MAMRSSRSQPTLFAASGPGLQISAPKIPTFFTVSSLASDRRLRVSDLKLSIRGAATVKPDVSEEADGSLLVTYVAQMSGDYKVTLSIGPSAVAGSPFRVPCQQPQPSELRTTIDVCNGHGFVDEPFTGTVSVRDQFDRIYVDRVRLTATVVDIESESLTVLFPATVAECGDGEHKVKFTPTIAGIYGLEVLLNGNSLEGSPFRIRVRSDETIPSNCRLYGFARAVAGQRNTFFIQAVNGKAQARTVGGDAFQLTILGPVPQEQLNVTISDTKTGTYNVSWSTTVAADYVISAQLDGYTVGGCPVTCSVEAGQLDVGKCTATGNGLSRAQAGVPAKFRIKAVDSFGNQGGTGGDSFDVAVRKGGRTGSTAGSTSQSSTSVLKGQVEDEGRGVFGATFVATFAGPVEICVTSQGRHILGSPFVGEVVAGNAESSNSRLFGPGLRAVQLGRDSQLFCELADAYGNKVESAMDNGIEVRVQGPAPTNVTAGGLRDGVHAYSYCARATGRYIISALVNGIHLNGSPSEVEASTAKAHPPLCEVIGAPIVLNTIAGEQAHFTLCAKDAKGVRKSLGGDAFALSWQHTGSDSLPHAGRIEDLNSGEYSGVFTATAAGVYSVSVTLQGSHIAGSPFPAEVSSSDIDLHATTVVGEGLVSAISGIKAFFAIRAVDRFGNAVAAVPLTPSHGGFKAEITGNEPVTVHWEAASGGGGSRQLTGWYHPTTAGTYHLAISYDGTLIPGSPHALTVAASDGHASLSTLTDVPTHLVAGQPTGFGVVVRDAYGNNTIGRDKVEAFMDSSTEGRFGLTVEDDGVGNYRGRLEVRLSGIITVSASVNGQLVSQPKTLGVVAGPLVSLRAVSDASLQCTAGETITIAMVGLDAFGNEIIASRISASSDIVAVLVMPGAQQDGKPKEQILRVQNRPRLEVSATIETTCKFEVHVTVKDDSSGGFVTRGVCSPGMTCIRRCSVVQPPTSVRAGEGGTLTVARVDAFGNTSGRGDSGVVARGGGAGGNFLLCSVHDREDGLTDIRYSSRVAGKYSLSVAGAGGGDALPDSPFDINVLVGEACAAQSQATLCDCDTGCVRAGARIAVDMVLRDALGNLLSVEAAESQLSGNRGSIVAQGPAKVRFTGGDTPGQHVGTLETAGAYLVHVHLGTEPVPGWPRVVYVTAAGAHPAKCTLEGAALDGLVVGQLAVLTLVTNDKFGNACATESEAVDVTIRGRTGAGSRKAATTDNRDGTYTISFRVDQAGHWLVTPRVAGEAIQGGAIEVPVSYGALTAGDCTAVAVGSDGGTAVCGGQTDFRISPSGTAPGAAPRKLSHPEALTTTVTGPSGWGAAIAATVAEGGTAYKVTVPWAEVGRHTVAIRLHGELVRGSPMDVDTAPQELSIASCVFEGEGLTECTAGNTASFRIRSCDTRGFAVASNSAAFTVAVVAHDQEGSGDVISHGEGCWGVSYVVKRAGEYKLTVGLMGCSAKRVFQGVCSPGQVAPATCEVYSVENEIIAGRTGQLRFQVADRFRNWVTDLSGQAPFVAEGSGPGDFMAEVVHITEAELAVRYTAQVVGRYSLLVRSSATGEVLRGSPFHVGVLPGDIDPFHCSAAVVAVAESSHMISEAGCEMAIATQLRDSFGNLVTEMGEEDGSILVIANGPTSQQFAAAGSNRYKAVLETIGSYALSVTFCGKLATGWPKALEVVPSTLGPFQGSIKGDSLHGVICGRDSTLTLTTADRFGNPRLDSGDEVVAVLVHEDGARVHAAVVDTRCASYSLQFQIHLSGEWTLTPCINGAQIPTAAVKVTATFGPLTASECRVVRSDIGSVTCGTAHTFYIQPSSWGEAGRGGVGGHEAVMAIVKAPNGIRSMLPVVLEGVTGRYSASLRCSQEGTHEVSVMLDHVMLPGCPFSMKATATEVSLASCQVSGKGLSSAVAGSTASFTVKAADANGNAIETGGAKIRGIVVCESEEVVCEVADSKDGHYTLSFVLTKAGPFTTVLSHGSSNASVTFKGVSSPAAVNAAKCVVTEADTCIKAGKVAKLRVRRFDRFGNRIFDGQGQAALSVEVDGPGALATTPVDLGEGEVAVHCRARVVGSYTIGLRWPGDESLIGGSLIMMTVTPGRLYIPSCRAQFRGPAGGGGVVAGEEVAVQFDLRDCFGNRTAAGPDTSLAVAAAGAGVVIFAPSRDSIFRAVLTASGSYSLRATIGGHTAPGWPRSLHVTGASPHAPRCWLTGLPTEGILCGSSVTGILHTADEYGNTLTAGGTPVTVHHMVQGGRQGASGRVVDNGNGTYAIEFTLSTAGSHRLHVEVDCQEVTVGGHVLQVVHGPLKAAQCRLVLTAGISTSLEGGYTATCGEDHGLVIEAVDGVGGRSMRGREVVCAQLISPSGAAIVLPLRLFEEDSRLGAQWQWVEAGQHRVVVSVDGRQVTGSPLTVHVGAGLLEPQLCLLPGLDDPQPSEALPSADWVRQLRFQVVGRDAFGNSCPLAPKDVQLVSHPPGAFSEVTAVQDTSSSASVDISAMTITEGTMEVLVLGTSVRPLPIPLLVSEGTECQLTWINGQRAPEMTAGTTTTVLLESKGSKGRSITNGKMVFGNVRSLADGAACRTIPALVTERATGLLQLTFQLDNAGPYRIQAGITGSPSSTIEAEGMCQAGTVSPVHCAISSQGLLSWTAGIPSATRLRLCDRFGNAIASAVGRDLGSIVGQGSGPGPITVTIGRDADGVAGIFCTARVAGNYVISVTDASTGENISGSPLQAELKPGGLHSPACAYSVVSASEVGRGVHHSTAGASVAVCVTALDRFGNLARVAAAAVRATAAGPGGIVPLLPEAVPTNGAEALASGQLRLSGIVIQAGTYELSVAVGDPTSRNLTQLQPRDSPHCISVVPGVISPRHTGIEGLPSVLTAGVPSTFTIWPADEYGNRGASGGTFTADLAEGNTSVPVIVEEHVDGPLRKASAAIVAATAGSWILTISVHTTEQQQIVVGQVRVRVKEGPTSAVNSFMTGFVPEAGAIAGAPAGFVIMACDQWDNQRKTGGDRFIVEVRGAAHDAVTVTDRGNGSYKVDYCLPVEGIFTVTAMQGGRHVRGSPSLLTVFRDVASLAGSEMETRLAESVVGLRRGLAQAKKAQASLRDEAAQLESFIPVLIQGAASGITDALKQQEDLLSEARAAFQREALERRRLHNIVQELRGNIRVYVRAKPLTKDETMAGITSVVRCDSDHRVSCFFGGSNKVFDFDRVFGPESQQEEVFADVSQLVTSALDGYNVCVFAYGQTGAGKTFTMEGSPASPGINYRTMRELFRSIEDDRSTDTNYTITCSIIEIYNEVVHDLLAIEPRAQVELQKNAAGFEIPSLTHVEVTSPGQIFDIMAEGFEHRAVGCHDINAHSSRSHCLLVVHVVGTGISSGVRTVGKLTLCDLAGSERINKTGATGLTLTEAQNINRSLLELGNVISALMQQAPHVPYRNSKLTMLLQDSLGGDSKALMFCNIAPAASHAGDTFSSLNFASKVANVVLKTPQRKLEEVAGGATPPRPQPLSVSSGSSLPAQQGMMAPRTPVSTSPHNTIPTASRRGVQGAEINSTSTARRPAQQTRRPQWSGTE